MAVNSQASPPRRPVNGNDGAPPAPTKVGPHPGFIFSSNQYTSETKIRRMLKDNGCDLSREENYRLQGVQLIDNVRKHLHLCVTPGRDDKERTTAEQVLGPIERSIPRAPTSTSSDSTLRMLSTTTRTRRLRHCSWRARSRTRSRSRRTYWRRHTMLRTQTSRPPQTIR